MREIQVRVPAKINLQLSVGPRREDGYHELATVFCAVGLYDTVTVRPAPELTLRVTGPHAAAVPTDESNLAARAACLLAAAVGRDPQVRVEIDKHIPVAGGMAGGSADAAATLVALARLWDLPTDISTLHPLAAQLGSDVAFPLLGGVAVGTGRGEMLRPVPCATPLWWVVAPSPHHLSTPAVFAALDRQRAAVGSAPVPAPHAGPALLAALAAGDVEAVARSLHNDLQPAAVELLPDLARTLTAGDRAGALATLVSGSGPTCLYLARDKPHAQEVAQQVGRPGDHVVQGPVVGTTARNCLEP